MKKYGTAAGLSPQKLRFHGLKHSIATHRLDADADIAIIQDWLGHANTKNTKIYVQVTTRTRDENARKLFTSHQVV